MGDWILELEIYKGEPYESWRWDCVRCDKPNIARQYLLKPFEIFVYLCDDCVKECKMEHIIPEQNKEI